MIQIPSPSSRRGNDVGNFHVYALPQKYHYRFPDLTNPYFLPDIIIINDVIDGME